MNKITVKINNLIDGSIDAAVAARTLLSGMALDRASVTYTQLAVEADLNSHNGYGKCCQEIVDQMVGQEMKATGRSRFVTQVYLCRGIAVGRSVKADMKRVLRGYKGEADALLSISNMMDTRDALEALSDATVIDEVEAAAKSDLLDIQERLAEFAWAARCDGFLVETGEGDTLEYTSDKEFLEAWCCTSSFGVAA